MDRVVFKNCWIWFLTMELICCNNGTHWFFVDGALFLHTISHGCFFMSPAIKLSKSKPQPWMTHSLEKLNGKAELKTLLQKFFGYMVNDEQMHCASPFAGVIEGPQQQTNVQELKAKLDNVGKSSGHAVVITALDLLPFCA